MQTEDFDIGAEFAALTAGRTDIGGIGCFVGTVRNNALDQRVAAMTLEHYPAMTERAIARITEEAERRWGLLGCTVIHRVGRLVAGDNIVLVLAAAAHRQAGAGCDGVPDRLAEDQGAVLEEGGVCRGRWRVGRGARCGRRGGRAVVASVRPLSGTGPHVLGRYAAQRRGALPRRHCVGARPGDQVHGQAHPGQRLLCAKRSRRIRSRQDRGQL